MPLKLSRIDAVPSPSIWHQDFARPCATLVVTAPPSDFTAKSNFWSIPVLVEKLSVVILPSEVASSNNISSPTSVSSAEASNTKPWF